MIVEFCKSGNSLAKRRAPAENSLLRLRLLEHRLRLGEISLRHMLISLSLKSEWPNDHHRL